jgi:hypothetical protein
VLHDWADGGIDRAHQPACYRQALKELPADLRVYSSAPDDIRNALAQRVHHAVRSGARKLTGHGVAGVRFTEPRATATAPSMPVGLIVLSAAAGSLAAALAVAAFRRGQRR